MPTYAVKIGEVDLRSDKPITDEERKAAMKRLAECPAGMIADGTVVIRPTVLAG